MPLENLESCPLCGNASFKHHLDVRDHSVSHGTFEICRCNKCDLLFTNPRPHEDSIGNYYDSESYISHHDEAENILTKVYNQVRKLAVNSKLKLVSKLDSAKEKRILDIGCGTGYFLSECQNAGWGIAGTEPDEDARKTASTRTKVLIANSIFSAEVSKQTYTTITMWHVLEHVHKLHETLDWIYQHLTPKGTLIVAVPNPDSYDAEQFGPYWAAYDVPRHLYHFTKNTMAKLMLLHNLHIIDIKPMHFDSYYVSLLSNQYKTGSKNLVSSFLTGTMSNIKGIGNNPANTNSSSLIYVIQKK